MQSLEVTLTPPSPRLWNPSRVEKRREGKTVEHHQIYKPEYIYCMKTFLNYTSIKSKLWLSTLHKGCCCWCLLFMTGFKLRKRKIINEPTGGTGNCPHLVEAIPCEEASCFEWLVVKLEECLPDNDKECGLGTQIPQVQCVNSDGEWIWNSDWLNQ